MTHATYWRAVADRLAARLVHHAFCEDHDEITEGCPFCDDIAAFEAYQRAGGTVRLPSVEGESVSVFDLPRSE